jgi:hypothetical protein
LTKINGSLTVEASLVFPIVFFAVISLFYISIYLHDVTCLKSIVDETASRYELALSNKIDFETGNNISNNSRLNRGLYWRLNDNNEYNSKVERYIAKQVKDKLILDYDSIITNSYITNSIGKKSIDIKVTKSFHTPINIINKLLSMDKDELTMTVRCKAVINDQEEFVRNINLLDDISDCVVPLNKAKHEYENKVKKILDYFNK